MQSAVIRVTLNKVTEVPLDQYSGFKIFSYLNKGLPYGYIDLKDRNGSVFAEFNNLQIGAKIDLEIINLSDDNDILKYPTFYILQIEDDFSFDPTSFAGIIRVWFGHPWFLFKDPKNHAFKPTNSAELIKKILRNKDRGMSFNVDNKNFDKTDDDGANRYKICETDWDFINNKIMPYTTIEQLPAHFYCNELHEFYLKSYKTMYKESSKALFMQNEAKLGDENTVKEVNELCDKNNIKKETSAFSIGEASIQVGDINITREIFPNFYFEDLLTGSSVSGKKKFGNKLKNRSGKSFGNILPLDESFMHKISGTSIKMVHNRSIIDTLSLLFETSKAADNFFTLQVVTPFTGNIVTIGQPIELYTNKIMLDKKRLNWISGKWLITGIEHYNDEDDEKKLVSRTTLIRPSFVGNEDSTTLAMLPLLYNS